MEGWASRVIEKKEDPEKLVRWSTIKIQLFITVYRACRSQVNLDINTAYAQQWREITGKGSTRVDPREKTIINLKKLVKKEIEAKSEVVMMIDANESAETRTEEMMSMIQERGLIATHLIVNPFSNIETSVREKGKTDYILMTPRIQQIISYF